MEKNFKKLIKASALEAIVAGNKITDVDVDKFLENVKEASFEERKAISLGRDYKLNHLVIEGSALTFEDMPLYINANSKNNPSTGIRKEETGMRRRPNPRRDNPDTPLDGPWRTYPLDPFRPHPFDPDGSRYRTGNIIMFNDWANRK